MGLFDSFLDITGPGGAGRLFGDASAKNQGRERSWLESYFDPGDLLALGDHIPTETESILAKLGKAPFNSPFIQSLLPASLRLDQTGKFLQTGINNIGELLQNPGGTSSGLQEAIAARRAQESQSISQNFAGIGAEQSGQAARTNLPVSIKGALEKALVTAQARAERGSEQKAVSDSEVLRREDTGQTFNLMDAILQFLSSAKGQAVSGLAGAAQLDAGLRGINQQSYNASLASLGSALSGFGSSTNNVPGGATGGGRSRGQIGPNNASGNFFGP